MTEERKVRGANKYGCQEASNIIAQHFEHTILRFFLSQLSNLDKYE